jgi:hypothetical protein
VETLLRTYGAASLEEAFFAATGKDLSPDAEADDDDDERDVFG